MKNNSVIAQVKGKSKKPVPGQGSKPSKPAPVEKPAKGSWGNGKPIFKAAAQPKVTAATVKASIETLKKEVAFLDKEKLMVKELRLIIASHKPKSEKNLAIAEMIKKFKSTK